MGYNFLITLPERFVPDAQLCNDPAPYGCAHAWIMPDAAAYTLLDLLCDPLLFHDSGRTFVITKYLFPPGRRNRAERGSNDFEDLFDLV
jgi:hypothetical protein